MTSIATSSTGLLSGSFDERFFIWFRFRLCVNCGPFYDVNYVPYPFLNRTCFQKRFVVLEQKVNFLSWVVFFVGTMLAVAGFFCFGSSLSYTDRIRKAKSFDVNWLPLSVMIESTIRNLANRNFITISDVGFLHLRTSGHLEKLLKVNSNTLQEGRDHGMSVSGQGLNLTRDTLAARAQPLHSLPYFQCLSMFGQ